MSSEAPIEFCPHRADLEHNVQYQELGEVQYFEPEDSTDELNGNGEYLPHSPLHWMTGMGHWASHSRRRMKARS